MITELWLESQFGELKAASRRHWRGFRVERNAPVSHRELEELEVQTGSSMPDSLKSMFGICDGFKLHFLNADDSNVQSFAVLSGRELLQNTTFLREGLEYRSQSAVIFANFWDGLMAAYDPALPTTPSEFGIIEADTDFWTVCRPGISSLNPCKNSLSAFLQALKKRVTGPTG